MNNYQYGLVAALLVFAGLVYGLGSRCQSCESFAILPQLRLPYSYSRQGFAMKSYPNLPISTKGTCRLV